MIISMCGIKGGCGKSTLTAHLAGWLADSGKSVLVVDADHQRAVTRWLPEALGPSRIVQIESADELLDRLPGLAEGTQAVLVDGPAGAAEPTRAILLRSDLAILPVGPSVLDLVALKDTIRIVNQAQDIRGGLPEAVVVMNRMQLHVTVSREVIEAAGKMGVRAAKTVIRQRAIVADAPGQRLLVSQMGYAGKGAAADFDRLFSEVLHGKETADNSR